MLISIEKLMVVTLMKFGLVIIIIMTWPDPIKFRQKSYYVSIPKQLKDLRLRWIKYLGPPLYVLPGFKAVAPGKKKSAFGIVRFGNFSFLYSVSTTGSGRF